MTTKLSLTGSISYEAEINNFVAAKIIALVEQDSQISAEEQQSTFTPELGLLDSPPRESKRFAGRSLVEIFEEIGAKVKPYQVVVAGYRSMEESGEEWFSSKQIIEQFRSAGVNPKNLDREIKRAISMGLAYTATGEKGKYKVTEKAIKAFDNGFNDLKLKTMKSANGRSKRVGSTIKLEISEAVQKLPIEVSLENYPGYYNLKVKSERIMWLLIFAGNHGVNSLNSKEIEYLSKELRDQITSSSIAALTTPAIKKGYIAKSGTEFRVLHEGDLFIKDRA
jgi:hypothetical protein